MRRPKSKSDCYVQLCVIMKHEWVAAGGVGQRRLLSRAFNGRAGFMDLLRWRHVDMPRASVPQSSSLESISESRPRAPVRPKASSSSLFYGSLLLDPSIKRLQVARGRWQAPKARRTYDIAAPTFLSNYRKACVAPVERCGHPRRIRYVLLDTATHRALPA